MPFDVKTIEIEDFLDCLEIRNVRRATESEYVFSCPYPAHTTGDENPSAYMNGDTKVFFCQSCHARGNAIQFAADVLGVSQLEAIRMLKQRYSPGGINPDSRNMLEEIRRIRNHKEPERRQNVILPESSLNRYTVDWQGAINDREPWAMYMVGRKFTASMLNAWKFGYIERLDRITLPVRDHDGNLVGIKARAWKESKNKYLNLRDTANGVEPYLKNDIVFGLDRARHVSNDLIIVEGEYNVVFMHEYGYTNTVAINGSYFGDVQIRLLKQFADSVTLFFDSDPAGRDATEAFSNALRAFMPVYICPDHHGDPAAMHPISVRACVHDRVSLARRLMALTRS